MLLERPERVGRARGMKATGPRQQRGQRPPVEVDGESEQEGEQLQRRRFSNADSRESAARSSAAKLASLALGRATTTRCIPPGHRSRRLRNSSRSRRRTAFRTTAVPTLLDTVSPSRDAPSGLGATRPTSGPAVTFFPRSWTSRKSRRLRRRASLGNAAVKPYFLAADTARRFRPFARRRRRTSWPARVLFRFRKPWVRLRFTFDGWYVRFDTGRCSENGLRRTEGRAARITQPARSSQCGGVATRRSQRALDARF